MIKADYFVHPMRFTGDYFKGPWSGYRFKEPLGYAPGVHTGVDYNRDAGGQDGNVDKGDAAFAVADGEVILVIDKTDIGFGKTIIMRHEATERLRRRIGMASFYTRMMHFDTTFVKAGNVVKAGERIATVGNTGTQYVHIHLDMWDASKMGWHLIYHSNSPLIQYYVDPFKVIQSNLKGDEDMIEDKDNQFRRWQKLARQIRGQRFDEKGSPRPFSRDEFKRSAVGQTWLRAMEILSDSEEADLNEQRAALGWKAERDNWRDQILSNKKRADEAEAKLKESVVPEAIAERIVERVSADVSKLITGKK